MGLVPALRAVPGAHKKGGARKNAAFPVHIIRLQALMIASASLRKASMT